MSPENKPSLINRSVVMNGIATFLYGGTSGFLFYEGQNALGALMITGVAFTTVNALIEVEKNIDTRRKTPKNAPLRKE